VVDDTRRPPYARKNHPELIAHEGCVCLEARLGGSGMSRLTGILTPDPHILSESLYRLSYTGPRSFAVFYKQHVTTKKVAHVLQKHPAVTDIKKIRTH
jgi:hypothetical protein